ncbi:MAG: hypothetical protein AAFR58_25580 [Cyanobacteria bacterium J06627_28]
MSIVTTELAAAQSMAADLRAQGYSVVVEPDPSKFPFDLRQYRPDILATRGNENLIIEIKTKGFHRSVERYQEIAEIVSQHKNWRFMLSTIDEGPLSDMAAHQSSGTPDALVTMLEKLKHLLASENYDLAVPYLWSVYILAMRLAGERADIPIDLTSDQSVLNYMYSLGEISSDEYEWAKNLLEIRNRSVHTVQIDLSKSEVVEIYNHIEHQLAQWQLTAS